MKLRTFTYVKDFLIHVEVDYSVWDSSLSGEAWGVPFYEKSWDFSVDNIKVIGRRDKYDSILANIDEFDIQQKVEEAIDELKRS